MPHWTWFVVALIFLVAEAFISSGCVLMVFAFTSAITGAIATLEFFDSTTPLLFIFFGLSILLFLVGLKPLRKFFGAGTTVRGPSDIPGEEVKVLTDIAPGQEGQGEMRGTSWKVSNRTTEVLAAQTSHRVKRVDGLMLIVQ